MTAANLRLSVRFAARFKHLRDLEFEDLVQAANLGVIRAVEKFDPTRGYKFSTYAYWWIRKAVMRHIEQHGVMISMPGTDAERLARLAPVRNRLQSQLGREPSMAELGEVLGVTAERLQQLARCNSRCLSLDLPPPGDDPDVPPLGALLQAPTSTPYEPPEGGELLELLPPIYQRVVAAAAGFEGPPQSAAAIARSEQMSEPAVRKLLIAAGRIIREKQQPGSTPGCVIAPPVPAPTGSAQQQALPVQGELSLEPVQP
ncbi:MAG: sigma-70 family RNA polymerase sigma factor [Cyanobacteria bacterium J06638_7]